MPKPSRMRGGPANRCQPKGNSIVQPMDTSMARSELSRGAGVSRNKSPVISISGAGTPRPWELTLIAPAPSAWPILPATAGRGTPPVSEPLLVFEPFPFYRGYSTDFFDGKHYVMKGGSMRTAACMLRRSFRNWFQPLYPHVYATFRCVEN